MGEGKLKKISSLPMRNVRSRIPSLPSAVTLEITVVLSTCIDLNCSTLVLIIIEIKTSQLSMYVDSVELEISIFFEFSMSFSINKLILRFETRCTSRVMTALTNLFDFVSWKYIDSMTYLFVVCFVIFKSRTDMNVIIVLMKIFITFFLKKISSRKVISTFKSMQSKFNLTFDEKLISVVTYCYFLKTILCINIFI